ncbi:restriction endonuclease subunit S [Dietzia maris]
MKSQYALNPVRRDPLPDDEILTAFRDGTVTLRKYRREEGFTNAAKEIGYQRIEPGDLVVHSMDGGFGAIGVSDSAGKASPVVHAYRSTHCDVYFLAYFLRAAVSSGWIAAQGKGIRERSTQFDRASLSRLDISFPPLPTQRAIADYLDRETAEIDAMAAELDELVETLNERRSAAVRRAVLSDTNLGNTNTPTLGALSDVIRRGISPTYSDRGVAVVSQKCVRTNGVFDIGRARQHREDSRTIPDELLLRNGDALINSTGDGTLGRTAIVRCAMRKMTLDSHVTLVRTRPHLVHPDYLGYFLATQEEYLIQRSQGSTKQTELAQRTVYDLRVPLPSLDEQRHIADYLDTVTAEIDSMIADARELKALLAERRSALITEVVTGRKEVPVS